MIEYLNSLDTSVFLAINGWRDPAFDGFMKLASNRFVWVPLYVALLIMLIRRYGAKQAIVMLVGACLAIALADQICATLIRPLVCRLRPANLENPLSALVQIVGDYRGGRYGFPSCHAANTFALTSFMYLAFRHSRTVLFWLIAWALLNCWSRIYLGVHYPGDLLVGAVIGWFCGLAAFALTRYVALKTLKIRLTTDDRG